MHAIQNAAIGPLKPPTEIAARIAAAGDQSAGSTEKAEAVRGAFVDFIGKTFFGQMLKAMRTSVGKPAYFHGGQAEEIFRSQLDDTLADVLTENSASQIADPLFERQFPAQAALLKDDPSGRESHPPQLGDLDSLRRR